MVLRMKRLCRNYFLGNFAFKVGRQTWCYILSPGLFAVPRNGSIQFGSAPRNRIGPWGLWLWDKEPNRPVEILHARFLTNPIRRNVEGEITEAWCASEPQKTLITPTVSLAVVRDPGVMEAGQTDWCSSIITGQPRYLYCEFLYRPVMDHTVARTVLVTCRYVPQ